MRISRKVNTETNKNHRNNTEPNHIQKEAKWSLYNMTGWGGGSILNSQSVDVSVKWEICNGCLFCPRSSQLCTTGSHVMILLQCIYNILAFFAWKHSTLLADVPPAQEWLEEFSWCAKEDAVAVKPNRTQMEREWSFEERGAKPLWIEET